MNSIFILALIVAVTARIVTQESIFGELQAWARSQQDTRLSIWHRKLTYPLQCQFCFSVWVSLGLALYLYRYQPLDLIFLSMGDWAPVAIATTVFVLVGLANVYLIAYETLTVHVTRIRLGNHHRTLNLDWKRTEFGDWKEWRAEHKRKEAEREAQRHRSLEERPFLMRVSQEDYGYSWGAKKEGLEQ